MNNTELSQEQRREIQERTLRALITWTNASQKLAETLNRTAEAFKKLNSAIKNEEVSKAQRKVLFRKGTEILEFTQSLGFDDSEILPYLTDEILAEAVSYELSPQTVCECLINDKTFNDLYAAHRKKEQIECLKKGGLI